MSSCTPRCRRSPPSHSEQSHPPARNNGGERRRVVRERPLRAAARERCLVERDRCRPGRNRRHGDRLSVCQIAAVDRHLTRAHGRRGGIRRAHVDGQRGIVLEVAAVLTIPIHRDDVNHRRLRAASDREIHCFGGRVHRRIEAIHDVVGVRNSRQHQRRQHGAKDQAEMPLPSMLPSCHQIHPPGPRSRRQADRTRPPKASQVPSEVGLPCPSSPN